MQQVTDLIEGVIVMIVTSCVIPLLVLAACVVVLLRRTLLEPLLSGSLGPQGGAGAPSFEEYMGVLFTWRGETLSCRASVVVLLAAGAVCLVLTAFRFARPRRQ